MLLFCQPFMLTGSDLTNDVKQNVFWSKHDMDLTIRELDKKLAFVKDLLTSFSIFLIPFRNLKKYFFSPFFFKGHTTL